MTDDEALHALRLAEAAKRAAGSRPPAPAWYAPARGLLFAPGFALLTGPWAGTTALLVAGIVILAAFLGVHAAVISRGDVIAMPGGPAGGRTLRQLLPVAAYALGWLAALPFGQAGGAIASAVLGGGALWAVTAWEQRRASS